MPRKRTKTSMPYQGIEMEGVTNHQIIAIMSSSIYTKVVTRDEAKRKYDAHQGALSIAFTTVLASRTGRLMKHPLPTINFWRHAYDYIRQHHLYQLPKYSCCGRKDVDAWMRVIQAYYLKFYDFNKYWNEDRFRRHEEHRVYCKWSAPIGKNRPYMEDFEDEDEGSEWMYEEEE